MVEIERIRQELGEQSKVWSDEQIGTLRNMMYNMVELAYTDYLSKNIGFSQENNYNVVESDLEKIDASL